MSEAIWYYVDRAQQRTGPVSAADIAEAHRVGMVDDHSLVWREGLGAWTPLSGHRDELGILGPPTILPTPRAHYPPAPPQGMSKKTGCLLVGVGIAVVGVPILAILAAIALPAYQDYVARSQVTAGLADIRGGVTAFEESINRDLGTPASVAGIGLPDSTERCSAIGVRGDFDAATGGQSIACLVRGNPKVDGAEVVLARSPDGNWDCTVSGADARYLPAGCSPR